MNLLPYLKKIKAALFSFPPYTTLARAIVLKYFQPSLFKTKKFYQCNVSLSLPKCFRDRQANRALLPLLNIPTLSTWRWNNPSAPKDMFLSNCTSLIILLGHTCIFVFDYAADWYPAGGWVSKWSCPFSWELVIVQLILVNWKFLLKLGLSLSLFFLF